MRSVIAVGIFFLFAGFVSAQNGKKRPMNVDDAIDMVRVGDGLMSPDGN